MRTVRLGGWILGLGLLAGTGAGCGEQGRITFLLEAPADDRLNPFRDPRRDFVSIADLNDESNPFPLGRIVGTNEAAGVAQTVGTVAVGRYDVRAQVLGGGQLIGMARTPGVEVLPLQQTRAVLAVRKPLAFYLSQKVLNPGDLSPGLIAPWPFPPLHGLDPTLEPLDPTLLGSDERIKPLARFNLPACKDRDNQGRPPSCSDAGVTATTFDGKLLLVALPGRLVMVATDRLFDGESNERVPASVTIRKLEGQSLPPNPRAITLSRDSSMVAVATDQGVGIASIEGVVSGNVAEIGLVPFVDEDNRLRSVSALTFTPEQDALMVLAGPTLVPGPTGVVRYDLNCKAKQPTFTYQLGLDGTAQAALPAPDNATDLAYAHDGRLLFAVPCDKGVVLRDGRPELAGNHIGRLLTASGRVFAVDGTVITTRTTDPEQPEVYTATVASYVDDAGKANRVQFQVKPAKVPTKGVPNVREPVLSLAPSEVLVYEMAATPDASRLLLASRTRYVQKDANSEFSLMTDGKGKRLSWCTLEITRDVYRVTEVDTTTSAEPAFDRVVGVDDGVANCRITCTVVVTVNGKDTQVVTPNEACSTIDGFVPGGLSLSFGSF